MKETVLIVEMNLEVFHGVEIDRRPVNAGKDRVGAGDEQERRPIGLRLGDVLPGE